MNVKNNVTLVTGGAGFIGSNYLYKLYEQDPAQKVICLDALTYAANYNYILPLINNGFVEFYEIDISNAPVLDGIFHHLATKYDIENIVHFAAESHVDNSIKNIEPFIKTNIHGTINLLNTCLKNPNFKKFVHVSTDEVYGSLGLDDDRSFVETSHYETNSPYSASKAASDCFVRAFYKTYGVPAVITNCSNNYGPNQHEEKLIPTILRNALANKPIPVYGDGLNIRDWLYVEDHCIGIDLALQKGVNGERYNIGGGVEIPNIVLVKKILDALDKPHSLINYVTDRVGHDLRYSIDCTKIKTDLGYEATHTLEVGLEKTIKWYINNPTT